MEAKTCTDDNRIMAPMMEGSHSVIYMGPLHHRALLKKVHKSKGLEALLYEGTTLNIFGLLIGQHEQLDDIILAIFIEHFMID